MRLLDSVALGSETGSRIAIGTRRYCMQGASVIARALGLGRTERRAPSECRTDFHFRASPCSYIPYDPALDLVD